GSGRIEPSADGYSQNAKRKSCASKWKRSVTGWPAAGSTASRSATAASSRDAPAGGVGAREPHLPPDELLGAIRGAFGQLLHGETGARPRPTILDNET